MKIKVNPDKVGEVGAKLLLIGVIMMFVDAGYSLLTWLVAEEWRFMAGGGMIAVTGAIIVIIAVIAELRIKGEL